MKKLQFDIVNIDIKSHHYNAQVTKGTAVSKEKVLRLAQEQGRLVPVQFIVDATDFILVFPHLCP